MGKGWPRAGTRWPRRCPRLTPALGSPQLSAAPLGAQTQLLGSLAATPVIANTISSVQGITGQILTNAQGQVPRGAPTLPPPCPGAGEVLAGPSPSSASPPLAQVIGTLPWVVNPPGMAAAGPAPAPSLHVQTVTPQLLLNAQGQVIATLAGGTLQAPGAKKTGTPEPPARTEVSGRH